MRVFVMWINIIYGLSSTYYFVYINYFLLKRNRDNFKSYLYLQGLINFILSKEKI
nr:MAG TPA: hypothetical protein [Caudoviricetes sp.]